MFTFELICMLLEGYLKFLLLVGFFGVFKIIKIFGFLAHTQSAQANCQRRLSLRRPFFSTGSHAQANCQRRLSVCVNLFPVFFSAHSACVGNFLAQTQPAQAIFQRRLSLRRQFFSAGSAYAKKTKWRIPVAVFEKKNKNLSSPQVTYPYRIYWCKKMGQKSHTWAPLRIEHLRNIMSWILLPGTATKRSITQHAYGSLLANFSKTQKSCDVVALSFILLFLPFFAYVYVRRCIYILYLGPWF